MAAFFALVTASSAGYVSLIKPDSVTWHAVPDDVYRTQRPLSGMPGRFFDYDSWMCPDGRLMTNPPAWLIRGVAIDSGCVGYHAWLLVYWKRG